MYTYEACPESTQPAIILKKQTFIEEDTSYKKHCTQDNDNSVPFKVGTTGPHTVLLTSLPPFETLQNPSLESYHQLPRGIFLNLTDGL